MTDIILYAQDPHALKRWLTLKEVKATPCFDLTKLTENAHHKNNAIVLIHLNDNYPTEQRQEIEQLIQYQYKILILSNNPNPEEGSHLFKMGVKGYLNTFSEPEKIQLAIQTIESGHVWLGQMMLSSMISSIHPAPNKSNDWKKHLTKKEIATLEEILKGKTNRQIAQALDIKEKSVKAKITKILEKLNAKDRLDLVLKVQHWAEKNEPIA